MLSPLILLAAFHLTGSFALFPFLLLFLIAVCSFSLRTAVCCTPKTSRRQLTPSIVSCSSLCLLALVMLFHQAFRAPIGGVMFALEEAISFFDANLIARSYFICIVSYYVAIILGQNGVSPGSARTPATAAVAMQRLGVSLCYSLCVPACPRAVCSVPCAIPTTTTATTLTHTSTCLHFPMFIFIPHALNPTQKHASSVLLTCWYLRTVWFVHVL